MPALRDIILYVKRAPSLLKTAAYLKKIQPGAAGVLLLLRAGNELDPPSDYCLAAGLLVALVVVAGAFLPFL